mgnify:CR=1 FL=1
MEVRHRGVDLPPINVPGDVSVRIQMDSAMSSVDGNLKVDQKRQVKSGPPEHYWTGDYCGRLVRDSGFGSP